MTYIDSYNQKYKTIKKDGQYYLVTVHYDTRTKKYYKVEVKGKQNVLTYIKNNKLRKYEEEWLYD